MNMKWDSILKVKLTKEKKEKCLIVFLLGIFFLLIATPLSSVSDEKKEEEKVEEQEIKIENQDAYIESLENKLEQIIGGMEGAGKVTVMITLKDNGEKILDKNVSYEKKEETDMEEGKEGQSMEIAESPETVLVEENGDTKPYVIKEISPRIEGIVVVCEGGGDTGLSLRIKEALVALFSIEPHKISVCK